MQQECDDNHPQRSGGSRHLHDHRLNTNSLQQECDDNHPQRSGGRKHLHDHRLNTNSLQQECDDNHPPGSEWKQGLIRSPSIKYELIAISV